jgi:3-hydroxyisobutyrate dehydrogenase
LAATDSPRRECHAIVNEQRVTVGFIGLGSQGAPIARRIIESGHPTVLWARRSATLDSFRDTNAIVAASPAELAAHARFIGICVVDDNDVEDVLLRSDGIIAGIKPGAIVAIHSTIHPATCTRIGERLADKGALLIDAPVSGGGGAAASGELLVMVGADDTVFRQALPILSTFGNPVLHLGPLGSGQLAKLVNNLLFISGISLAHDATELGSALGLDPETLIEVLGEGSARSFALSTYAGLRASGFSPDAPGPSMVARLLRKDVDIACAIGLDRGAPLGRLPEVADAVLATLGSPRTPAPTDEQ